MDFARSPSGVLPGPLRPAAKVVRVLGAVPSGGRLGAPLESRHRPTLLRLRPPGAATRRGSREARLPVLRPRPLRRDRSRTRLRLGRRQGGNRSRCQQRMAPAVRRRSPAEVPPRSDRSSRWRGRVVRDPDGALIRRAGIMGVVVLGGIVRAGDGIDVQAPPGPPRQLERV